MTIEAIKQYVKDNDSLVKVVLKGGVNMQGGRLISDKQTEEMICRNQWILSLVSGDEIIIDGNSIIKILPF